MRSPLVYENSYFMKACASEQYETYLHKKVETFKNSAHIQWWNTNSEHRIHCTIVHGFNTPYNTINNEELASEIKKVISLTPSTLFFKPTNILVSINGWVIVKFKPKAKLQRLHDQSSVEFIKRGIQLASFSGRDYCPHISIGSLVPSADPIQAQAEADLLLKELQSDPIPFVMQDIELVQGSNPPLLTLKFPIKRSGIIDSRCSSDTTVEIFIDTKRNVEKLCKYLWKYFDIKDSTTQMQTRSYTPSSFGIGFKVTLSNEEYTRTERLFHNMEELDSLKTRYVLQRSQIQKKTIPQPFNSILSPVCERYVPLKLRSKQENQPVEGTTSPSSNQVQMQQVSVTIQEEKPHLLTARKNLKEISQVTKAHISEYGILSIRPRGSEFSVQFDTMKNAEHLAELFHKVLFIQDAHNATIPKSPRINRVTQKPQLVLTRDEFMKAKGVITDFELTSDVDTSTSLTQTLQNTTNVSEVPPDKIVE